ncbi:MAG: nucleotide exchange factor GrpE [Francisella sp.]
MSNKEKNHKIKDQVVEKDNKNNVAEDKEQKSSNNDIQELSIEEQLEKAQDRIKELESNCERCKDDLLRAKAEMENVRKRAERDISNARKFSIEKFAQDLIPVLDSIDQALKHDVKLEESLAMKEGIALTAKILLDVLKKNGIEELDPKGEKFDPNLHEAMSMIPNPEFEDNTIFDVFQKGYVLNGRVIRAAKVVVVKN